MHYISVFYHIVLSFGSYEAFFLGGGKVASAFYQFVVRYGLSSDKSLFKIGMDLSGSLRRLGTPFDGPCPNFRFSCCQERDKVQKGIRRFYQLIQA